MAQLADSVNHDILTHTNEMENTPKTKPFHRWRALHPIHGKWMELGRTVIINSNTSSEALALLAQVISPHIPAPLFIRPRIPNFWHPVKSESPSSAPSSWPQKTAWKAWRWSGRALHVASQNADAIKYTPSARYAPSKSITQFCAESQLVTWGTV